MSQSENPGSKLGDILNKIKAGVKEKVARRVQVAPSVPEATSSVASDPGTISSDPSLMAVRWCKTDIASGAINLQNHPNWKQLN